MKSHHLYGQNKQMVLIAAAIYGIQATGQIEDIKAVKDLETEETRLMV